MSSGQKITITWMAVVAITVSISGISTLRAQNSSRPTLMDRFTSFKGSFNSDESTTRQTTSQPARQSPSRIRYGSPTYGSRSRANNSSPQKSSGKSSSGFSFGKLLPDSLFGRKKPAANDQQPQRSLANLNKANPSKLQSNTAIVESDVLPQIDLPIIESTSPIVGPSRGSSANRNMTGRNQARKSPNTTRHENLQETLSALRDNDALIAGRAVVENNRLDSDSAIISDQGPYDSDVLDGSESIASDQVATAADDYIIEDEAIVIEDEAMVIVEDELIGETVEETEEMIVADDIAKDIVEEDLLASDLQPETSQPEIQPAQEAAVAESQAPIAIAVEEAPQLFTAEPVVAEEPPLTHARFDLHDVLLSDELYEDLSAEVDAPGEIPASVSADIPAEVPSETFADVPSEVAAVPSEVIAPIMVTTPAEAKAPLELEKLLQAEPAETELTETDLDEQINIAEQPIWDELPAESHAFQSENIPEETQADRATVHDEWNDAESNPLTRISSPSKDVLVSTEQPVIVSHVEGPSSILVGREASYRVILENTSRTAAQNLSAVIHVPEWADLIDVQATSGVVQRIEHGKGGLDWQLPELAAHSSHTIHLRLIPRSGRKFQLGVQWNQESIASQAVVEVREPKLEMKINGPQEVLFGSPQRYQLTLSNPGNATAEGVAVRLIPPGSDASEATTHAIGSLRPEEVKEFELELTAREAGDLILQANASAAGGLNAEVIRRVLCRKPEIEIDWRGPDKKYAGTDTAYYFRISNSGTATTKPVEVKARLPEGIRFLSASDSYAIDSLTGVVTWRLQSLRPGEEQFVQFHCQLEQPGMKEFDVTACTINGDVHDSTSVRTEVVALADLKLTVNDPRGAHPIGEPVLYEIRVENRGTTDARRISIVGLFSEGIDPVSVEGAQNSVRDGRVTFQPVKSLPAGGEVLLKIRAVASHVGTHIFRAEVVCEDLDIRLAAEETTRFFEDEFHWDEGETPYTATKSEAAQVR
jgi:hypothetical protein